MGAFVGFVEDVNVNVGDCVGGSVGTFVGRTEGAFAHTLGVGSRIGTKIMRSKSFIDDKWNIKSENFIIKMRLESRK